MSDCTPCFLFESILSTLLNKAYFKENMSCVTEQKAAEVKKSVAFPLTWMLDAPCLALVLPLCLSPLSSTQTDKHNNRISTAWTQLQGPVYPWNNKQTESAKAETRRWIRIRKPWHIYWNGGKLGLRATFLTYLRWLLWQHFLLSKCVHVRLMSTWLVHEHTERLTSWRQQWINHFHLQPPLKHTKQKKLLINKTAS